MNAVYVLVSLFLAVTTERGGWTPEDRVSTDQSPMTHLLDEVLSAMDRALDFMDKQKANLNVDGVLGLRMVADQLGVLLDRQGNIMNSSSTWANLLTNMKGLQQKAKDMADDVIAWVRRSQPLYYLTVGNALRNGLWALDYNIRSLSDSKSRKKGTILQPLLPVNIDACLNEILGYGDTWPPPCKLSKKCWDSVVLPEMTSYPLTHQIVYLEMANTSSCDSQLEEMSSGNTSRILDYLCEKVLTEAEGIESHGYPDRHQDLFAEQIALCGFLGYKEFFNESWVKVILSWQDSSGCYTREDYKEKRVKRADVPLEGGCSSHKTSLTLGALVASARFLLEEILYGANKTS